VAGIEAFVCRPRNGARILGRGDVFYSGGVAAAAFLSGLNNPGCLFPWRASSVSPAFFERTHAVTERDVTEHSCDAHYPATKY